MSKYSICVIRPNDEFEIIDVHDEEEYQLILISLIQATPSTLIDAETIYEDNLMSFQACYLHEHSIKNEVCSKLLKKDISGNVVILKTLLVKGKAIADSIESYEIEWLLSDERTIVVKDKDDKYNTEMITCIPEEWVLEDTLNICSFDLRVYKHEDKTYYVHYQPKLYENDEYLLHLYIDTLELLLSQEVKNVTEDEIENLSGIINKYSVLYSR